MNLTIRRQFGFGHQAPLPPGVGGVGSGGAAPLRTVDQGTPRLSHAALGASLEPGQSRQLSGLQRHGHLAILRAADAVSGMRKIDFFVSLNFLRAWPRRVTQRRSYRSIRRNLYSRFRFVWPATVVTVGPPSCDSVGSTDAV